MKLCNFLRTLVLGIVPFYYTCASAGDQPEVSLQHFGRNQHYSPPVPPPLPEPADLVIFNTKVITVDSNSTVAEALAIRRGQIVAVGKDEQIKLYKGPNTRMIDGWGRTVMPGLYDSQVQSYQASLKGLDCPAPTISSIAGAQDYIRKQVAHNPPGSWITLEQVYPTRLREGRLPTKAELDAATTNNPVYWNCGPIAIVNSKALEVSKITKDTSNPPQGEIVKDAKTFKPTGLLRNAASLLKLPLAAHPVAQPEQQREALKHLYQLYNSQGITSIGERNATPQAIDLFRDLNQKGELTVRINCSRSIAPGTNTDDIGERLDALTNAATGKLSYGPTGVGDDWVRIGQLSTPIDGDITTGTAYLRTPWGIGPTYQITEPAYCGQINLDPLNAGQLPAVYLEAAHRGWQLAADCTGDAAMDSALNCYEKVQFKVDLRQRRCLITHAEFQTTQNWERCRDLGLAADSQPTALYKDGSSVLKTLGDKRLKLFLPFKSWFDRGLIIGGGSGHTAGLDSLAAMDPWNPWLGIWTALTRQTEQGAVIHAEERLTRDQAIRLYTINNAYLNFEEKKKGSIEPGKFADLVMVDNDILNCPVDDVRKTKVLLTLVQGKVVWEAKQDLQASNTP
jgi:predicted amidohydrolase YtcJ